MQQASCLEGGPLLWIWRLLLHVNKKSDDDDDDDDDDLFEKEGEIPLKMYPFTFIQMKTLSHFIRGGMSGILSKERTFCLEKSLEEF